MMRRTLNQARQRVALTCLCLTLTVGAAWAVTRLPDDTEGWQIPDGAEAERNPVVVNPAVLAKGQGLYKSKCQRCHGVNGKGDGPDVDPNHLPSDLTDARRARRNPDGVMFYKIWNGRSKPKMPAMKTDITRSEVWTVIHYVKTLRRTE